MRTAIERFAANRESNLADEVYRRMTTGTYVGSGCNWMFGLCANHTRALIAFNFTGKQSGCRMRGRCKFLVFGTLGQLVIITLGGTRQGCPLFDIMFEQG
jgi:hypothetical protein